MQKSLGYKNVWQSRFKRSEKKLKVTIKHYLWATKVLVHSRLLLLLSVIDLLLGAHLWVRMIKASRSAKAAAAEENQRELPMQQMCVFFM